MVFCIVSDVRDYIFFQVIFGEDGVADEPREREFVKEFFVDTERALFSVHNFCRVGKDNFNRQPGKHSYSFVSTIRMPV